MNFHEYVVFEKTVWTDSLNGTNEIILTFKECQKWHFWNGSKNWVFSAYVDEPYDEIKNFWHFQLTILVILSGLRFSKSQTEIIEFESLAFTWVNNWTTVQVKTELKTKKFRWNFS